MDEYALFFETVIRYLCGLMSAYALSKEPFPREAEELAHVLLPSSTHPPGFLTTPSIRSRDLPFGH